VRRTAVDGIPGAALFELDRHPDDRGSFTEVFRAGDLGGGFVQANHSKTRAGVLRGLHFHVRQSDAWYVVAGEAEVGLADLRRGRDGLTTAVVPLNGDDPRVLLIPPGVAHGFAAKTDVDLLYWVDQYYDGSDEHTVAWDEPSVAVPWTVSSPLLSPRDAGALPLDWEAVGSLLGASP
jgi:dTDP-4-dehydrorhamnose 3,5-epimerase